MRTLGLVILGGVTLVSVAPLLCLIAAGVAATWLGCPLDEGSSHPCLVAGRDIGPDLNAGFVLGWLALVTWPGVLVSLCAWTWLLGRRLLARRASARDRTAAPPRQRGRS